MCLPLTGYLTLTVRSNRSPSKDRNSKTHSLISVITSPSFQISRLTYLLLCTHAHLIIRPTQLTANHHCCPTSQSARAILHSKPFYHSRYTSTLATHSLTISSIPYRASETPTHRTILYLTPSNSNCICSMYANQ